MDTNALPIGITMVNSSISCKIANSLQLINDCVALVSNMGDIVNPCMLIGKYKKLFFIFKVLSFF